VALVSRTCGVEPSLLVLRSWASSWWRAQRELGRLRLEHRRVARARDLTLHALGAAVHEGRELDATRLGEEARELDARLAGIARESRRVVEQAGRRVREERLAVQPTESHPTVSSRNRSA
jgi:hypothetical protein